MEYLYQEKAWTKPRTLQDGSMVEALPEDTFRTFDEFEEFTLKHEELHDTLKIEEGETRGAYETRVNQEALFELRGERPNVWCVTN